MWTSTELTEAWPMHVGVTEPLPATELSIRPENLPQRSVNIRGRPAIVVQLVTRRSR